MSPSSTGRGSFKGFCLPRQDNLGKSNDGGRKIGGSRNKGGRKKRCPAQQGGKFFLQSSKDAASEEQGNKVAWIVRQRRGD